MNEIPQGGAGGVPLHHDPQDDGGDPRAPGGAGQGGTGEHGPDESEESAETPSEEQGDATTAEPGRARRLGADERNGDSGPGGA
ncbi:hypothetical protein ACIRD3_05245 [Kitasatospora sp. NPDC093550]|uniref:hypothetical protein n=1 Tax=Kitasatospora sp. NPDC093550 TaxID=3364089 RepID=UPI00381306E5